MTKIEAIKELSRDGRRQKSSTASAKRAVKSCRALGLMDTEIRDIMSWLDYCDFATGKPYAKNVEQVWP